MSVRFRPALGALCGLAILGALVAHPPAAAQEPWADSNYRYRRTLTVENTHPAPLAAGDMVAYSYVPDYGIYEGNTRRDGQDLKIYYYNGSTNVELPQALLPMGTAAGKILFPLQTAIPGFQYYSENTNAGKTAYASLPAGNPVAFTQVNAANDDATGVVVLPFDFPFRNGTSNLLRIGIDGYVVPGGGELIRYDIDDPANAAARYVIMPWTGDFAISGPDAMGVYYSADATQAVVRWEVQTSAQGPVIAKFAVILKPDGSIRFVYSDTVAAGGAQPQKIGVGLGAADISMIRTEPGGDYSNYNDITYTLNSRPSASGYRVYYGNPSDDGKAGRVTPDPSRLVAYTFDDGTLQGWTSASFLSHELEALTVEDGVLVMDGTNNGSHPVVYAAGQTSFTSDSLVYAKMRATGSREVAILARANDDASAYGTFIDGFGEQGGLLYRDVEQYAPLGTLTGFYADPTKWHIAIMRVTGQNEGTRLQSKAFTEGFSEPAGWMYSATPGEGRYLATGALGLTGWEGGGAKQYLDWAYATNPNAENAAYVAGSEQTNPFMAEMHGTVTFNGAPLNGATVTLTSATTEPKTVTTDATGRYSITSSPGSFTVAFDTIYPGVFNAHNTTVTLGTGESRTLNAALTATDNIIPNPSFETPDPAAPSVKPLGWFRRSYSAAGAGIPSPTEANKNTVVAPWIYSSTEARTGTRSIGFEGTNNDLQAWEVESSAVATVNPDQRGMGPLTRVPPGATIYYSFYYKKSTPEGDVRHRPRYTREDDVNTLIGGGATTTATAAASDWTLLEGTYTMNDADTNLYPNFLAYRIYSANVPAGQFVYVDDVTVRVASVPTVVPAIVRGVVQDSQGNPLSGVAVAMDNESANPMADPRQTAVTDGVGRFEIYVANPTLPTYFQPWKYDWVQSPSTLNTYLAGPVTQLTDPHERLVLTYDPKPVFNLSVGKTIAAYSTEDANYRLTGAIDGAPGSRWSSVGDDPPSGYNGQPQYFVVDLGQEMTFGEQINQVTVVSDPAAPLGWQIRVSNTPPTSLPSPALVSDLPALESYGTAVYISPNGTGPDVTPTAGDLRFQFPEDGGRWADVVSNFSSPATGRYVMFLASKARWNISIAEFQIGTVVGTITGKVQDPSGTPVSGAYIGQHPGGTTFAITDAFGNYSLNAPAAFPITFSAHKPGEPNQVFPVSNTQTLYPGATPVPAQTIILPAASANLVPEDAAADAYASLAPNEPINQQPPANATDYDYGSRWITEVFADPNGAITETTPVYYVVDLGAVQNVNQVVIHWENAQPGAYHVGVATTYTMASRSGGNWSTVATVPESHGYRPGGGSRHVEVVKFAPVTARYIRIGMTKPGPFPQFSIWEMQAGLVEDAPLPPLSQAIAALRIAGGLQDASSSDLNTLNPVNTGDSTGRIDIQDAVDLARAGL